MPGFRIFGYRFNFLNSWLKSGIFARTYIFSARKAFSGILLSGILVIKCLLGEVENISGPVPVRDMRTVSVAPVSVVTSL